MLHKCEIFEDCTAKYKNTKSMEGLMGCNL